MTEPHERAAFANEMEGSLVRAIVGLREVGLKQAMVEIDRALERNPNFKLATWCASHLMAARGQPVRSPPSAASAQSVAPLQDEARVRLHRYLDAPRVDDLPRRVRCTLASATCCWWTRRAAASSSTRTTVAARAT